MKKILGLLLMVVLMASAVSAAELDSRQLKFRSDVMTFIREEGYTPRIDQNDNSIEFKKNGETYWVYVYEGQPFYVVTQCAGYSVDDDNRASCILAANEVNRDQKTAKVYVAKSSVVFVVESFTRSSEDYKYVFYRTIQSLDAAIEAYDEAYAEYEDGGGSGSSSYSSSSSSLKVSSVELANVDKQGNIITDYGKTLYDFNSQYTKPRLKVYAPSAGTYTFYVKFFTPTGLSTGSGSPSGYSYSDDVYLSQGNNTISLSGWGGKAPKWSMGDYRMEIYCNSKLLYTKYFTIY